METEFNLSEEIQDEWGDRCCKIEDVKEFIRLLKKRTYWVNGHSKLCEDIDKLAGDKLNGN